MNKIKIIWADGIEQLQQKIDEWCEQESPTIESAGSVTFHEGHYPRFSISVVYHDYVDFGGGE